MRGALPLEAAAHLPAPVESPEVAAYRQELAFHLERALKTVSPTEEVILRARFGLGTEQEYSLDDIARHYGVTRSWIKQLEGRALKKLRRWTQQRVGSVR